VAGPEYNEPYVIRAVKGILKGCFTFMDVGAREGFYTKLASKAVGRKAFLIAVEPNTDELFQGSLLFRRAVWFDDDKNLSLNVVRKESGTLLKVHPVEGNGFRSSLKVRTIRLDTILDMLSHLNVDLIKMDIEGAEYFVLTDPLLKTQKIKRLLVEVHYKPRSREYNQIVSFMKRRGFQPFIIQKSFERSHILFILPP